MFQRVLIPILFLLAVVTFCDQGLNASQISLESLFQETTDLERLTKSPTPAYLARQFSSYDRRSTDPSEQTLENWFANHDRNQYLRVEEKSDRIEYVLMDVSGPGVITRFWSANPEDGGIVRIYLDHAREPVIEMPLAVMLGGETKPFIVPFSGVRGRGWNCYFPIPYRDHCKITITKSDIYYLINYRLYEPETSMESFSMAAAEALIPLIRTKASRLAHPHHVPERNDLQEMAYKTNIRNTKTELMTIPGPAAIQRITCKVEAGDIESALRHCLIEIAFDGHEPSVWAPLGDFFATAPGYNVYQSLPMGALQDGTLYCHWVMPFREDAVISMVNHGENDISLSGIIHVHKRPWTDNSLYFHAKWRVEQDIPTRPFQDWNFMEVNGKGRYVGTMLHVANPVTQWWGEGDEKMYVDGEPFPSHFGTGAEDYFGYAWGDTTLFTHAYHNQVRCDGPVNFGHTCISRFHIMDDIPFTNFFRFDMEIWHWAETRFTQAATLYWYGAPGAYDNFQMPVPASLSIQEFPLIHGVDGAIEGEKMRVIAVSGGDVQLQSDTDSSWSQATQLLWRDAIPGDMLLLGFDVETAGIYKVLAVFTRANDFGAHHLMINGKSVGEPIDFYQESLIVTPEVPLGVFQLHAGENRLGIIAAGHHAAAIPINMFGLDYLRLESP